MGGSPLHNVSIKKRIGVPESGLFGVIEVITWGVVRFANLYGLCVHKIMNSCSIHILLCMYIKEYICSLIIHTTFQKLLYFVKV